MLLIVTNNPIKDESASARQLRHFVSHSLCIGPLYRSYTIVSTCDKDVRTFDTSNWWQMKMQKKLARSEWLPCAHWEMLRSPKIRQCMPSCVRVDCLSPAELWWMLSTLGDFTSPGQKSTLWTVVNYILICNMSVILMCILHVIIGVISCSEATNKKADIITILSSSWHTPSHQLSAASANALRDSPITIINLMTSSPSVSHTVALG